jgi:serine/threonine protein kinase
MRVFVHVQNTIYKPNVELSWTLQELQKIVERETNIPANQQIMHVDIDGEPTPMKEGTLEENGVQDECNIFLSVSQDMLRTKVQPTISKTSLSKTISSSLNSSITKEMFEEWDCEQLCEWLGNMKISPDAIDKCRKHELDGMSMLDASTEFLTKDIGMNIGPARKIPLLIEKIKNGQVAVKEAPIDITDSPSKKPVSNQDHHEFTRQQKCIKFEEIKMGNKIGSGGESTIYLGTYFGEDYAVKRILKVKSKELDTILMLDDPCLMKCHYWSVDTVYCYYLMDLMDTTLDEALYEKTIELSDRDKFKIIQDIVHGCRVLHSKKIVHKDLKPLNILLKRNKSGTIVSKISDFGISKVKQTESDSSVTFGITGTIRYLPLEFLQDQVYGYFTDVYAFGVILFEILYEELPWKEYKSNDEIIEQVGRGKTLASSKAYGKEWKDVEIIMKQCLGKADQRVSFEEIEKRMSQIDASKFQSKLIKISVDEGKIYFQKIGSEQDFDNRLVNTTIPIEIKRLGGKLVPWVKPTPRRRYRDSVGLIPIHIQEFCDAWSGESSDLENINFTVRNFKFGQEFALKSEEYGDFRFFTEHPNAILIGDGNKLVCTLMSDSRQDFEVWLLEENKDAIGPMPISSLLKELKVKSK